MELEYTDKNSRRSKVYIAVGFIIALIVGAVVFVALQASGLTHGEQAEMRQVVVATRDIASRKPIEEGDVATRSVPADVVATVKEMGWRWVTGCPSPFVPVARSTKR